LQGFSRIRLAPGEKQAVQFILTPDQMSFVNDDGQWVLEPGEFQVWLGGQQPNLKSNSQPANVVGGRFTVQA
jgi:beta-glucosidase